jgi:hypothetical protein
MKSKAENIRKLFAILGRYCNYCNYEIILHVVKRFGDVKLKTRITMYCDSIRTFEISTTVSVYLHAISALPDGEICKGFTQMAMKINKPTSVCTLYEIRQLKEAIAENASVHSYSVYIERVAESSVLVRFRVHPDCTEMVFAALTPDFTYLYNVTVVDNIPEKVTSLGLPAVGATEEDYDQTGDSGLGTGSGSAEYLVKDFLPGI